MGRYTKPKELDTHVELFGDKYHVVLLNSGTIDNGKASKLIAKTLKCDPSYAKECLEEVTEEGESHIYGSNLERCELIQELLKRGTLKLSTKVTKE